MLWIRKFTISKETVTATVTVFLAGAEGLGLACRLGQCFCTSCRGLHQRSAPLGTRFWSEKHAFS